MFSGFKYFFLTSEKKIEKPMTKRFLVELRSTNWRLDSPTAVMMPNMTQKMPPTIGCGMVKKRAPSFEMRPTMSMMMAPYWDQYYKTSFAKPGANSIKIIPSKAT